MTTFDVEAIRTRFPALALTHAGQPMAFFDGPGGTQVPESVIDAVTRYYRESNANHGGAFPTSERSDAVVDDAHAAIGDMLGVDADEITLGPNMTTLTFHLSRSIAASMRPGDEIVVTGLDHQANVDPWIAAARDNEIVVRTWEPELTDCTLRLEDLDGVLNERTRLVAVGWASNAVGTINPIAEIAERAHRVGAWLYVDAVHAAPHLPLDARAVDADFVACSTYKFFGPHLGIFWGREQLLEGIRAFHLRAAPHNVPDRFETGTKSHEQLAGLLGTLDYLVELGARSGAYAPNERLTLSGALHRTMGAVRQYERGLSAAMLEGLLSVPGVQMYGIGDAGRLDERVPTFAFNLGEMPASEVSRLLGERGIFTWHGNYYALDVMERLGLNERGGAVRVGAVHYNTPEEIERLVRALGEIAG
jgi:cysteine desulfurase family protein (TIGR01976 family)